MFHEFVIQGYTITAAILIVQYVFHKPYRESYLLLARMANRLLWFWCLGIIVFMFLGWIAISTVSFSLFNDDSIFVYPLLNLLLLLFFPFGIILIALFFQAARKRPLQIMCIFAVILNLSRMEHGKYISWSSLVYGLFFWVLVVAVEAFFAWVKKGIRSKDNETLPDRI